MTGIIFDIKKFAIHDGPGIRTTVFFKGCPLHCYWCHNPESIVPGPELAQFPQNCINCGKCVESCPKGAISRGEEQMVIDRMLCDNCGRCTAQCYAEALVMQGYEVSVEEVIAEVMKDKPFYDNSGGGMTLSGGEPMFQPDFALALLKAAKQEGLHNVVDTCGYAEWEHFEVMLPYLDLVLFDLKGADTDEHKQATGAEYGLIGENLHKLVQTELEIWIRVPVVPGFNADEEHMVVIAEQVLSLRRKLPVELLPYHRLGEGKYQSLGLSVPEPVPTVPTKEQVGELANLITDLGVECTVGG